MTNPSQNENTVPAVCKKTRDQIIKEVIETIDIHNQDAKATTIRRLTGQKTIDIEIIRMNRESLNKVLRHYNRMERLYKENEQLSRLNKRSTEVIEKNLKH